MPEFRRVRSRCCRSDVIGLNGYDWGECAKCGSPDCSNTRPESSEMTKAHSYYIIGMQRASIDSELRSRDQL